MKLAIISVRYIVDDVDAAISFYTNTWTSGWTSTRRLDSQSFRGGICVSCLNVPGAGGAGQAMPDGRKPAPGGWNRIQLEVSDLTEKVESLRRAGARFRNDIVTGQGGKQILLDDPAGNPIELLEPFQ